MKNKRHSVDAIHGIEYFLKKYRSQIDNDQEEILCSIKFQFESLCEYVAEFLSISLVEESWQFTLQCLQNISSAIKIGKQITCNFNKYYQLLGNITECINSTKKRTESRRDILDNLTENINSNYHLHEIFNCNSSLFQQISDPLTPGVAHCNSRTYAWKKQIETHDKTSTNYRTLNRYLSDKHDNNTGLNIFYTFFDPSGNLFPIRKNIRDILEKVCNNKIYRLCIYDDSGHAIFPPPGHAIGLLRHNHGTIGMLDVNFTEIYMSEEDFISFFSLHMIYYYEYGHLYRQFDLREIGKIPENSDYFNKFNDLHSQKYKCPSFAYIKSHFDRFNVMWNDCKKGNYTRSYNEIQVLFLDFLESLLTQVKSMNLIEDVSQLAQSNTYAFLGADKKLLRRDKIIFKGFNIRIPKITTDILTICDTMIQCRKEEIELDQENRDMNKRGKSGSTAINLRK